MAGKAKPVAIETSLLGRVARPSEDRPWCWPWAQEFVPTNKDQQLRWEKHAQFRVELLAERATVVGVRAVEGGLGLTLEGPGGALGEVDAGNIALVPADTTSGTGGAFRGVPELEGPGAAHEETETVYGRIIRKDVVHCIHGSLLGDHCHQCPQCRCGED